MIENKGLEILKMKMLNLSRLQAEEFYQEHEGKPFYQKLINFMTSGPVIGMELKGSSVIYKWRSLLGNKEIKLIIRSNKF